MSPINATLSLVAILLFCSAFNQFDNPRGWRRRRVALFFILGFLVLFSFPETSSLISAFAYFAFAIIDYTSGKLSHKFNLSPRVTWIQEAEFTLQGLTIWAKSAFARISSFVKAYTWKFSINLESPTARAINWIRNLIASNAAFTLFAIVYLAFILSILLVAPLALSIGLTSTISDQGTQATLLKHFGTLILMTYGPAFLLIWIFSMIILSYLASTFTISQGTRPLRDSIVKFSSAAGVGTAMGLILGTVSPAIWDRVHRVDVLESLVGTHPPIASDMTVSMSSIGLIAGAFFGTYGSLRSATSGFSNPLYREVSICGSVGLSAVIVNATQLGSPRKMAIMISEQSELDIADLEKYDSPELIESVVKDMNPVDYLKVLFELGEAKYVYSYNLTAFVVWSTISISIIFLVLSVFKNRKTLINANPS